MRKILNPPTPAWVTRGVEVAWNRQAGNTDPIWYGPAKAFISPERIHDAAAWRMAQTDALLPFERQYVWEHGHAPPAPKRKKDRRSAKGLSLDDLGI